jgi:enoyl-CoA hydratase
MLEKKAELAGEENRLIMLNFYRSFLCLRDLGVPLIAAINGHAIGAGLCVACGCDIRIAQTGAKLGLTFTKLGLHPGMGGTFFLPRLIGQAAASELILTGRVIETARALELGLVSSVVESGVVDAAMKIAGEIVTCGPEATRQVLEALRNPAGTLEEALKREALCQSINYAGKEFKEGVRATIEKRPPAFSL